MEINRVSLERLRDVIDHLTPLGTTSASLVRGTVVDRNLLGPANLNWPAMKTEGQRLP